MASINPFFFGTGQRRLFGSYEPAAGRVSSARAAVICYPWGPEYLPSHRTMRHLARLLTAKGCHTLRFDYFGTGDSAGEEAETTLEGWEADIDAAIEELKAITGATTVTLIGLRLGATLAAKVAARHAREVSALLMWDPLVQGMDYLRELHQSEQPRYRFLRRKPLKRAAEVGGGHQINGHVMPAGFVRELETIDLRQLAPGLPDRTLVVTSGPGSVTEMRKLLGDGAAGFLLVEPVEGPAPWMRPALWGVMPVKAVERIAQWVA